MNRFLASLRRLSPRKYRKIAFAPRLDDVLAERELPEGPRNALVLIEQALADAQQPLPFTPEDLAQAFGVRLSWLAREMDSEGQGMPGSCRPEHLERLETRALEALGAVSVFTSDSHQLLYLIGLMIIELLEIHKEKQGWQ